MSIHKKALFYGYNRYFEPPVHENGRFYGRSDKIDGIVQKIGPFLGREGLNDSSRQKRGVFVDKIEANKKETPPKGCLHNLLLVTVFLSFFLCFLFLLHCIDTLFDTFSDSILKCICFFTNLSLYR